MGPWYLFEDKPAGEVAAQRPVDRVLAEMLADELAMWEGKGNTYAS